MSSANSTERPTLIDSIKDTLKDLHLNPCPEVQNPPSCKKRASVALVLRIRPSYEHPPSLSGDVAPSTSTTERLDHFFSQSWVQHGDPECVFIKRATTLRSWTGHVALPGGKRGTVLRAIRS
jgi:hypothetical protein